MPLVHQSGAIVVRLDSDEPRVLLVTAKRNPKRWIFPKGHVEPGETAEAGALREAREEAGVIALPICRAGTIEHRYLGIRIRVDYFLAELRREADRPEAGRERRWCRLDDALKRLSSGDMGKLLLDAWKRLPG